MAFILLARLLLETKDEVIEALIAIDRGELRTVCFGCAPLVDQSLFRHFCQLHKEMLPECSMRPTLADPDQLAEEIAIGVVDAALVTLPLNRPDLRVEKIRSDRLVVCLRHDNPLARKAALSATDLQENLRVFNYPLRHPHAHDLLIRMLADAGVTIDEFSFASHPSELQMLVKEDHGFALISEGSSLDSDLTTRPIANVDWTIDTAVIYHGQRYPKTVPVLIKKLRRQLKKEGKAEGSDRSFVHSPAGSIRNAPQSVSGAQIQLSLISQRSENSADRTQ